MKAARSRGLPWFELLAILFAVAIAALPARAAESGVLVLTELPPLYSITASLAAGTSIDVRNVPADGRRMNALARYLEKPSQNELQLFKRADAVVSMGKLWREAPLFATVRAHNIRVVNIDATEPYSSTLPGVALMRQLQPAAPWDSAPRSSSQPGEPAMYFWLSPVNGARAAEIIAQDLMRLSPVDSAKVSQNLAGYRRALQQLGQEYEAKFATLDSSSVFALTQDFDYLLGDVGIFVEGYFVKQDMEWSAEDLRNLREYLRVRRIAAVIHKWEPSAPIQEAVRAGGAALVVLKTAEDGVKREAALQADGYLHDLRENLESLYRACSGASSR